MRHVDPDNLALLALGEQLADDVEREHLDACPECAQEFATLARAATVGRSTLEAGDLLEPDPRVWNRIVDELKLSPRRAARREPAAKVTPIRRWMPVIASLAAAAVVVAALFGWQALSASSTRVLATATLEAFPDWPGAIGEATVEEASDGVRTVNVSFETGGDNSGYHEVWLITSDATRLVSLGIVTGSSGTFTIPDGVDITEYDLVDISAEPYDGDPTHSGDSIVRGQLS